MNRHRDFVPERKDTNLGRLCTLKSLYGSNAICLFLSMMCRKEHVPDPIKALKKLDEMYPKGDVIRIICDNHSAHKSKETRNYLATCPKGRFVFVFTPKHGSWLNMIESFFSK